MHRRTHGSIRFPILAAMALVLSLAVALVGALLAPESRADGTPLRILYLGDSITDGDNATDHAGFRGKLETLITANTGMPVAGSSLAAGGWSVADVYPGVGAALLALQPDLVIIAIGTNDTGDVAGFEQRYRRLLGAIENISQARIALAFIQYSAPAWLAAGEASINDAVYRSMTAYHVIGAPPLDPRFVAFADFQQVPPSYLDSGGVHPCGVCVGLPADTGYDVYAHLWYAALAPGMGWPAVPWTPPIPLTGHRPAVTR